MMRLTISPPPTHKPMNKEVWLEYDHLIKVISLAYLDIESLMDCEI